MASWTVMTPSGEAAREDAVFIRDGFNWWAALLGPFWALVNRMWIVAILLGVAGILASLMPPVFAAVANIGLLLVAGIFGADLKIWSLGRRGFAEAMQLQAASLEEAELRFFASGEAPASAPATAPMPAIATGALTATDPLGLFGKGW